MTTGGGTLKIAVVGMGRMGRAVVAEATRRGHEVVAGIAGSVNRDQTALTVGGLGGAQVAIEFSTPAAAAGNLGRLLELGVPVVSGTTGWLDDLPQLTALALRRGTALLYAANFSIGAHLLMRAARELGRALAHRPELDAGIFEQHHRKKVDAPSGTALALAAVLRAVDGTRPYPIVSERLGWMPGSHRLAIDGEFETVTVSHVVRDRAVFAAGAVTAAEWLVNRTGVFGFEHVLFGGDE